MSKRNIAIWKKILAITSIGAIFAGAVTGITFSSINIAEKTKLSSDFDEGVTYSLKLNLVDKNNNPLYTLDSSKNTYTIIDEPKVLDNLKNIGDIVASQLQALGLTNISVSSGLGSYSYSNPTKVTIPIGVINMKFENSKAVFGLGDGADDEFLDASKIEAKIGVPNRYSFEYIKDKYDGYSTALTYGTSRKPLNHSDTSSILADKDGDPLPIEKDVKKDYFYVSSPENIDQKVEAYKNADGVVDSNAVQLVQPNYYYLKPFIDQKFAYDKIEETPSEGSSSDGSSSSDSAASRAIRSNDGIALVDDTAPAPAPDGSDGSDGSDGTTPPPAEEKDDPKKQFQPDTTWFIWSDKQGFINHINSLVLAAYYNRYANNINAVSGSDIDVGTPPSSSSVNTNAIDTDLRKKINTYLDSLSEFDKRVVKFFSGFESPKYVTEDTLMGFLYQFYNSTAIGDKNTVGYVHPNKDQKPIDKNNPQSTKDGWGFLDPTNNDLSELWSGYLIGRLDCTNFSEFFQDPRTSEELDELKKEPGADDKPLLYTTQKFKLPNQGSSQSFADVITNQQYTYPILDIANDVNLNNINNALRILTPALKKAISDGVFGSTSQDIFTNNEDYKVKLAEISKNFSGQVLFGQIATTRQRYETPAFYNYPIFNILMIALAATILIVGIIVSILYRVPGMLAGLFSALTFVGSLAFFNIFGFTFSFFSFVGLIIGTVLSFLTPFYIFKNFKKEISEGSSIFGAYIKTLKKYWKLSLDVHVIPLLISFSFLFFGTNQLVDFGALLTISTFLSAFLNTALLFVSIIILITLFEVPLPKYFMTFKQSLTMRKMSEFYGIEGNNSSIYDFQTSWYHKKVNNFHFYTNWRFIGSLVFALISLIGVILLFTIGPGSSVDFSGGYTLTIFNADLLPTDFINKVNTYVGRGWYTFDNVMYIPVDSMNTQAIYNIFNGLTNNKEVLLNSYSVTEYSNFISSETIRDAFVCFGISLGFIAVWLLISINWVSIVPVMVVQLVVLLIGFGWMGIARVEVNIEAIAIMVMVYTIASIYATGVLSSVKISWDRKRTLSFLELKELTNAIVSRINSNYINFIYVFIFFAVIAAVACANLLIGAAFFMLVIDLILLPLIIPYVLLPLWFAFVQLKNIYVKELVQSSKNKMMEKRHNYDLVDEQLVKGLNC